MTLPCMSFAVNYLQHLMDSRENNSHAGVQIDGREMDIELLIRASCVLFGAQVELMGTPEGFFFFFFFFVDGKIMRSAEQTDV